MSFRLSKKSTGKINTVFHVLAGNDLIGSVNVPNAEVPNFLSCWQGPTDAPQPRPQNQINAMAQAFLKARTKFSPQQLLRS